MVGSSKILTVSYGTFSCTLEGFDDSFDTMKAIAEYFRDLASDDRYFGAEPPTPDAEMLARIAEREISRRVEASEQQGRIVLRADTIARESEVATEKATPHKEHAEPTALAAPQPESTQEPVPEPEMAQPEMAPEEPREELAPVAPSDMPAETPEPIVKAVEPPEPEWQEPEVAQAEPRAPLTADPNSFAAKLHLIRSVVSGDAPSVTDQYSEDEHAQDFGHAGSDDSAFWPDDYEDEATDEVTAAVAAPAADSEAEAPREDAFEDTLAALLADEKLESETAAEPSQKDTAEDDARFDDEDQVAPEMNAEDDAVAETDSDVEEDMAEDEAVAGSEDTSALEEIALASDTVTEKEALTDDATPVEAGPMQDAPENLLEDETPEAPIARVVKVKRAALDEMIEQGLFEEDADADEAESDTCENMFEEEVALSPEEEAELQRELAELEAEFDPDAEIADEQDEDDRQTEAASLATREESAHPVAEPADHTPSGRRKLARAESEIDLSRIFEETDSQLEAPASSQRRNTIQHLRAALEATRAEKAAGSELKPDVDQTPYRSDLADVVRPRRPQALPSGARSARPVETRPAPLKLVAEQRVDTERGPIRPRRVSTEDIQTRAETARDGGFTAFAEKVGASALPDLLEAAAAYLADVEGRSQFSRPMLMGKLKEIEQDRFSREDGLRSFGKLLREGKLQKLSGGRFAITEDTEFRAQDKRQAG
ncbi:hypothetical protein RA2_03783 [Roseovarius sp. A-2]|uniref:hypothetical protein n=1 Tax=Roseovarius sp. A-2 TaxID=1570360 RepID=UPI0009CCBC43|nr:hypothetical protein [Roseovarius sp. A-2]GAW36708.1 hypothetical protein RA2_03783 [Roseovarius sp. A-2]